MSLLKSGYTGAALIILGGLLGIASWFSPWFTTTTWGKWIIADYPVLVVDSKIWLLWSLVVLNCLIVLAFVALIDPATNNRASLWCRVAGLLCLLIAGASSAALYIADSFMNKLFFGPGYVSMTHSTGFYELAAANLLSLLGSFIMVVYPIQPEQTTVVGKDGKKQPSRRSASSKSSDAFRAGALLVALIAVFIFMASSYGVNSDPLKVSEMQLPEGFKAHVFADGVPEARSMAVSPHGTVYVGTRNTGDVYAILDRDRNHRADYILKIATGLWMPNGIAFKDGHLYVAEPGKLWRFENIEYTIESLMSSLVDNVLIEKPKVADAMQYFKPQLLWDKWPAYQHHGWRYMKFGPDGRLYVAFGADCNICSKNETWFATIMRKANPLGDDWSDWEVYASGIRNSVGFDWHPTTGELWFTENGRDFGSHNFPPDELNRAPKAGLHFGFPECVDKNLPDPDLPDQEAVKRLCEKREPSQLALPAHCAALGIHFYRGKMFPKEYHGNAFIAEHGSWNRVPLSGYKVSRVTLDDNSNVASYSDFITGFLRDGQIAGRPVDIAELNDGSLLVSDDYANKIYRIYYRKS